jgi:acyl dehydratase
VDVDGDVLRAMSTHRRELLLSAELLRAYSPRGNFHSDADEASRLGLPGLVAQGMQVAGPAYGILLDEWGEEFLDHGEIELKFVGMVTDGETVEAEVTVDRDQATLEVGNRDRDRIAAVGRAWRRSVAATDSTQ